MLGARYIGLTLTWPIAVLGILLMNLITETGSDFTCNQNDTQDCSCVIIDGPQDATVLTNTNISLSCSVTNTNGNEVQWIKGDIPLGSNPTIPSETRYSMGDNYALLINNVQISDEDNYKCQVDDCVLTKQSAAAHLTVYELPSEPVVANETNGMVDVLESEISTLRCSTSHARPSASIWWYNSTDGQNLNAPVIATSDDDGETFSYVATFTFIPESSDNGTKFECSVQGDAIDLTDANSLDKRIVLRVIDKPSAFIVTGIENGGTLTIDLDKSVSVSCNATTTESNLEIYWTRDGDTLSSTTLTQENQDDGSMLVSSSIQILGSDENNGAMYACTVKIPSQTLTYQDSIRFSIDVYKFPLGWVIGGSILGSLLLIALIILIVCCCLRRKDKETTFSEPVDLPETTPQQEIVLANPDAQVEVEEAIIEPVGETTANALQNRTPSEEWPSSSDSDEYYTEIEHGTQDDEDSVNLPDGDVFSLSSSMMRSDRGSPVPHNQAMDDDEGESSAEEQPVYLPPLRSIQSFYV